MLFRSAVELVSPGEGGAISVLDGVSLRLDGEDPGAWLEIEGVVGASVVNGAEVTFTPDQPLEASWSYTAYACWCGGAYSFDFGTLRADAVVDPYGLAGRTWVLPLSDGFMSSPPTLGATLQDLDAKLLVQAIDADEETMDLRLAWAEMDGTALSQAQGWSTLDVDVDFTRNPGDACEPCSDANPYCLRLTWELLEGDEVDLDLSRTP